MQRAFDGRAELARAKMDWLHVQCEVAYVRTLLAAKRLYDAIQSEAKFNPYHDELGRFTTADGAGSGGGSLTGDQRPKLGSLVGADEKPAGSQTAEAEAASERRLGTTSAGTNKRGEITSRGSFRTNTLKQLWDSAQPGPNGGRLCSNGCGKELQIAPGTGQPRDWDVSHNPSWTNRSFPAGTTRQDARDNYQTGTELECAYCNRSGGNNDNRFSNRKPISEGQGGRRDAAPIGGSGGGSFRPGLKPTL